MRIAVLSAAFAVSLGLPAHAAQDLSRIQHIVVIFEENRSFDSLYGDFPGANGLAQAKHAARQVDFAGKRYRVLPPVCASSPFKLTIESGTQHCDAYDMRFPLDLKNAPFDAGKYIALDQLTGELTHHFPEEKLQIDEGRMDKFAAISSAGGLTMGHFDGSKLKMWKLAREYVLADNFFHAAFGGSFLNHMWLACACTPVFKDAPQALVDNGTVVDGHAVNTIMPTAMPYPPRDPAAKPAQTPLPPQDFPTIGDRMSDAKVSWAWYGGGYADAMAGTNPHQFQYHHQPYVYFSKYAQGQPGRDHLKDGADFERAVDDGSLPQVAFYKPVGDLNQHPHYATITAADDKTAELVRRIQANATLWAGTVIVVTYDENGGAWDHVKPPKGDEWGPGTRVPAIVISPFAKHGFVDHTQYDTTSILKFIERRFGLAPLTTRDAAANDLTNALRFCEASKPKRVGECLPGK